MGFLKLTYRPKNTLSIVKSGSLREANVVLLWLSVDPLAEEFPGMSPYSYVYNNPLNYTDSTGMCPDGDCPEDTYVGKVNELEDVYITNKPQGSKQWTSESTEAYSGTMAQYQSENTEFAGMSNAETEYRYNERYNSGMDYHNWKIETEGQMRLGAFINRFKYIYDTGALQSTEEVLQWSIGGTSATLVGKGVMKATPKLMSDAKAGYKFTDDMLMKSSLYGDDFIQVQKQLGIDNLFNKYKSLSPSTRRSLYPAQKFLMKERLKTRNIINTKHAESVLGWKKIRGGI